MNGMLNGGWNLLLAVLIMAVLLGVVLGGAELLHPNRSALERQMGEQQLERQRQKDNLDLDYSSRKNDMLLALWGWPMMLVLTAVAFTVALLGVCSAYYLLCKAKALGNREAGSWSRYYTYLPEEPKGQGKAGRAA